MTRRYLAQALLIASLGAFAATGYAQTNRSNDQAPGSPGAAAPAAGAGTTAGSRTTTGMGTTAGTYGTTHTGKMHAPMTSAEVRAYEQARAACDNSPAAQRDQCWSTLTTQYSGVSPKCQKLTGNALDACVHANATADNAGK